MLKLFISLKGGEKMKMNNGIEEVSEIELRNLAGGADGDENSVNWITITIPISAALCPTTKCASVVKPCNG